MLEGLPLERGARLLVGKSFSGGYDRLRVWSKARYLDLIEPRRSLLFAMG
jgi:hypothetical protein